MGQRAGWPIFALVCHVMVCTPVSAGDWQINSSVSETVEANDNPQLLPDSPGGDVGSLTTFSLDAINESPTLRLGFGADLTLRAYTGPGALDSYDGLQGDVRGSLEKTTKLTKYDLAAFWQRAPASVSELTDSGILAADTIRDTYFANAGLLHQLNDLNALGWSVSGTSVTFTDEDEGLSPYNDISMSESWVRSISPTAQMTAALGTQWYQSDNVVDTESLVQRATLQLDRQLTSRMKIMGRAGGGVAYTDQDYWLGLDRIETSDTSGLFIGAAELAYELKNTVLAASASHDFAPSSLGEMQERTSVGVSIDHKINERSGILLNGQFFHQLPGVDNPDEEERRQALILAVSYSRNVMRDWDLILTYRFVEQQEQADLFVPFQDGSATSNAVFVTLNRELYLFARAGQTGAP